MILVPYILITIILLIATIYFIHSQGDDLTLDLLIGLVIAAPLWPICILILIPTIFSDVVIFKGKK